MRRFAKKMENKEIAREKSVEFEKTYFQNLIAAYAAWEADDSAIERFFEDTEWMRFPIRFANDSCVIIDAGVNIYIEWGINECPIYVDIDGEYTYVGRVRNSRFWALADRFKNKE